MYSELEKVLPTKPIRHILNTSGFSIMLKTNGNGAIRNWFVWHWKFEQELKVLENVSTLKPLFPQIREVSAKESIGYSRRFRVTQK